VHAVGNAHIDPVWIWDWREGMHEVLQTFRSALDRLAESPGLVFTASSASHHAWVERVDPAMFAEIRARVDDGRWVLVGGQWVEPDCNIPSGESVCRQLLYGQRWFADHLGRAATVGCNVDSFGHAGSLPQLLARSGLRGYVMMRPSQDEMPGPAAFRWHGVDGTPLPTYRIPDSYSSRLEDEAEEIPRRAVDLAERAAHDGHPHMLFFGVGDHGGGPTRRAIGLVEAQSEAGVDVAFGSPESYFEAVGGTHEAWPVVAGDLHHHAVGCYSALSWIKQLNAQAEAALGTAETLSTLAGAVLDRDLGGAERIAEAWRSVLFTQFHDSLGGTCSAAACGSLRAFLEQALAIADDVTATAVHAIAQQVDTWVDGADGAVGIASARLSYGGLPVPVLVFNPASWTVRSVVELSHPLAAVTDLDGARVPCQQVSSHEVTYSPNRLRFLAEVPPVGWRLYWAWSRSAMPPGTDAGNGGAAAVAVTEGSVDNGVVRAEVDSTGLCSLVDAATGHEWLAGESLRPVVLDDDSDTWSHGVVRYSAPEQPCVLTGMRVIDSGPLLGTLRLTYRYGASAIVVDIGLVAGSTFVSLDVVVDWHEAHKVLKFVVPAAIDHPVVTAGLPYGHAVRGSATGEDVFQHWIDVSGTAGPGHGGLGCTVDHRYGYDAEGARLRVTGLRSPRFADHGMGWGTDDRLDFPVTDQGVTRFGLRLHPHAGDWREAALPERAQEQLVDLPVVIDSWHGGSLPRRSSGVSVEHPGVHVTALKRAESAPGWVLRLHETRGEESTAVVELGFCDRRWHGRLRAGEVATLFVPDDEAVPIAVVDIPELALGREDAGR
jgi:alpha-mannosidase